MLYDYLFIHLTKNVLGIYYKLATVWNLGIYEDE